MTNEFTNINDSKYIVYSFLLLLFFKETLPERFVAHLVETRDVNWDWVPVQHNKSGISELFIFM